MLFGPTPAEVECIPLNSCARGFTRAPREPPWQHRLMDDEDVLGPGWTARTLRLRPDGKQPDPVATLVHRTPDGPAPRRAVLYLHGFVDYFFQTHVGDALADAGHDVYALDMRDYGRSIRPGREPNYTTDLSVYAEEIDAAFRILLEDHHEVALIGHSTGGLIAALWADARPGLLSHLVLNSPWLDMQGGRVGVAVLTPTLELVGKVAPRLKVQNLPSFYAEALNAESGGEWTFDLAWKPSAKFPVRAGFVRAVRRAHARVAKGLDIDCPVLVLASDARGRGDRRSDTILTTDSVLDPAQIKAAAPLLGADVRFVEIPGGAHDLSLSPKPARDRYLEEVLRFLDEP
jgi:alpha-beta hydrolase superfamily lysophospholipase